MSPSRRTVLAAAPLTVLAGSAKCGSQYTRGSDALLLTDFGPLFGRDDALVIQAALQHAFATDAELVWPAGAYEIQSPISAPSVRIRFSGGVTLIYTGSTHIKWVFNIGMSGRDTALLGRLVVDGRQMANIGLNVSHEHPGPADLTLGDIEARNCRMVRGQSFNGGAAGIVIRGNIGRLQADRLWAANISREAGSGRIGFFGTSGVEISRTAGYAPRHIKLGAVGANDITTDDPPGSAQCFDIDGVSVFQNDIEGASLDIGDLHVTNAQGRALKTQCYRDCQIRRATIMRSIAGMTDGANEIAFQSGEGRIGQAEIVYTGNADTVHGQGTTCLSTYTSARRDRYGPAIFENIVIRDRTVGETRIGWLIDTGNQAEGAVQHSTTIRNVRLDGGSATALVNVRRNGGDGRGFYALEVNGFSGLLTDAVVLADGAAPHLSVRLSEVSNTGDPVPAVRLADGTRRKDSIGRLELNATEGVTG